MLGILDMFILLILVMALCSPFYNAFVLRKSVAVQAHVATGCQGIHVTNERPDTQCGRSVVVFVATAHQRVKVDIAGS